MKILAGEAIAQEYQEKVKQELSHSQHPPRLAVIRVGEAGSQKAYEQGIEQLFDKLQLQMTSHVLPATADQVQLDELFFSLNEDDCVDGILLLQPLPSHLTTAYISKWIDPRKDLDCMGLVNIGNLYEGMPRNFLPCTAEACLAVLDSLSFPYQGEDVTIVGFGTVVGKPLALLLMERGCTVTLCQKSTRDLPQKTKNAHVLIMATGAADLIQANYVHSDMIVLDVGVSLDSQGKIHGDVDFAKVAPLVKAITPVPGGIGAITTSILAYHLVKAHAFLH